MPVVVELLILGISPSAPSIQLVLTLGSKVTP